MKFIDIAFDLDGTLIWLMPVVERLLWEKHKVRVPKSRKFRVTTEPEIPFEDLWDCFYEAFTCIDEIKVVPGATELLRKLHLLSDNDPVKIVTARPLKAANDTYKLVKKVCPDFPYELIIVEDTENKKLHLNRYHYFVDDRRKTALDLAEHGIKVYLPICNYNQPFPPHYNVTPIDSIQELIPIAHTLIRRSFDLGKDY